MTADFSQRGKIVGVDPGLNITGYSVLESDVHDLKMVEAGVLRSKRDQSMGERLRQLYEGLVEIIEQHRPQIIAVEEIYSHYQMPKTAILMGHARGVYCLAAALHDLEVFNYSATQIKKVLTGNGRAPKDQVQLAVMRQFNLSEPPDPPDVADAIAIATCHHFLTRATIVQD